MPKYIELEKAINLFYPVDPENDGSDGCTTVLKSEKYSSEEIESMLSDLPVSDVAPVVHGKWIKEIYIDPQGGEWTKYKCNLCGNIEFLKYPYCTCGAKMDLEDDE